MEYILDVPYVAQDDYTTCWKAGYKMMLMWKGSPPEAADHLPNASSMETDGIMDWQLPVCRHALQLSSTDYRAFLTEDGMTDKLQRYGPIWCSGFWAKKKHKHIVVVRGIRTHWVGDPDLYVNDPYQAFNGGRACGTWWTWESFTKLINPVAYACQHWLP